MLKKLASSFLVASVLFGTMAAPSYAGEDTFAQICYFPFRLLGMGVGTVVGVPLGMVKDGTRGSIQATQWVADKLGDEDGVPQQWVGAIVGGPFGLAGGAAYGVFDGGWHGMETGYKQPFSKEAFTFKDE